MIFGSRDMTSFSNACQSPITAISSFRSKSPHYLGQSRVMVTGHGQLNIDDLGYICTGDDVTCSGHVTSSKVTNSSLTITLEPKDIQRRGWSHCLVITVPVTCNMTYFTGHRVTLTKGQIFKLTSRGHKVHISIRLDERNTVVLLGISYL